MKDVRLPSGVEEEHGKTFAIIRKLIKAAQDNPKTKVLYISITKPYAIDLIWEPLVDLDTKFSIGIKFNHLNHIAKLPNGSQIIIGRS